MCATDILILGSGVKGQGHTESLNFTTAGLGQL